MDAAFALFNNGLTRGGYTHAVVWADIRHALRAAVDISLLDAAFASTPLNNGMFALARRLRPCYVVGVITDNKQDRMDCSERLHGGFPHVSIPSWYLRQSVRPKPIAASSSTPFSLAHVEPTECIFIDNSAWNLLVPREMGMVGKHFDDVTHDVPALIGELAELGVVLDDAT